VPESAGTTASYGYMRLALEARFGEQEQISSVIGGRPATRRASQCEEE
jgi:hypothetical protein